MSKLKFLVDVTGKNVETENLKIDTFNITKKDNNLAVTQDSTNIFMLGKNESGQSYFNLGTEVLTDSQLKALREGAVSAGATPLATDFTALTDFGRYKANSTVPATGKTLSEMIESAYFKASEGLDYTLNADGASYSVAIGTCTDTDVVIASEYEGKPVTSIGSSAFSYCSSLESITIPNSVTSIGEMAFEGCTKLESINIPDSVTSIGEEAFYDCSSLKHVTIGNGVTSINNSTFCNCNSLTSITMPNSVTSIGNSAFNCCLSLKSVEIPDSVTRIDNSAFSGCLSLTSITIPKGVTGIGEWAFDSCTRLTSIEIPSGATYIGTGAFQYCNNLTSVTIPDSITSIGNAAFAHCPKLTSIEIPDSVTRIDNYAFNGCTSLTIYCEAKTQPEDWSTKWNHSSRPVVWGVALDIPAINGNRINGDLNLTGSLTVGSIKLTEAQLQALLNLLS